MAFFVHWCLVTRKGRVLETGRFDSAFDRRAGAVGFVLDRLGVAEHYGFCGDARFWWLSGDPDSGLQTRLWIDADATICAQRADAGVV